MFPYLSRRWTVLDFSEATRTKDVKETKLLVQNQLNWCITGEQMSLNSLYSIWDHLYLYIIKNANCQFCWLSNNPPNVYWCNTMVEIASVDICTCWKQNNPKPRSRWMMRMSFFPPPNLLTPSGTTMHVLNVSQPTRNVLTPHWRQRPLSCPGRNHSNTHASCCARMTTKELQRCTVVPQKA